MGRTVKENASVPAVDIVTGYMVPVCVTQGAMEDFVISVVPGGPMELAVLWNVSVWKRTPWNAMPKMVVAPANLVTKATDARKKPALMASGDQNVSSPVDSVKMEVIATESLETATVLLVTQENPVPCSAHQARMGKTVTRYVSVQQRTETAIQSLEDVPACLATMETTVNFGAQKTLMVQIAKKRVSV